MKNAYLITADEAIAKFDVIKRLTEENILVVNDRGKMVVFEGGLELQEHLVLDIDRNRDWLTRLGIAAEEEIFGFMVSGDLHVHGSIINDEGDYGPALCVTGNISCQSLLIGGAPSYVGGNIIAEEVIFLHYNHGWMECKGLVTAPVFIADDYEFIPTQKNISGFYHNESDPDTPEENEYVYTDDDALLPPHLRKLLDSPDTHTPYELQHDLAAGEYVLRGSPAPKRDEAYWTNKVITNWADLKRVPEIFKTEALCTTALKKHVYAIQYFPESFINDALCRSLAEQNGNILSLLPEKFVTRELCLIAAKKGAILEKDIPSKYYDDELMQLIAKHSDFQMDRVPAGFITKALLVTLVKSGRGPYLDKYCREQGISKQEVLNQVIDDGPEYLENIFGWHLTVDAYHYAKKKYKKSKEWKEITTKYAAKIGRLPLEKKTWFSWFKKK